MIEEIRWVVAFTFLMFATYCYARLIYGNYILESIADAAS